MWVVLAVWEVGQISENHCQAFLKSLLHFLKTLVMTSQNHVSYNNIFILSLAGILTITVMPYKLYCQNTIIGTAQSLLYLFLM